MRKQAEADFPFLPAGCTVDLDRQSAEIVLESLKASAYRSQWRSLVADLASAEGDLDLAGFLDRYDHRLESVYKGNRSWTQLQREAAKDLPDPSDVELEARALRGVGRLMHVDDPERVALYRAWLEQDHPPALDDLNDREARLATMLAWGLGSGTSRAATVDAFFGALWKEGAVRSELRELLGVLDERSTTHGAPSGLDPEIPLTPHARYSRQEVVAALGFGSGVKPKVTQGGILWVPDARCDVFFVDLRKAERDYSPTTMYRDYAISRDLFHWESQSRQTPEQPTVKRYINHASGGTNVLLFVREQRRDELGTAPFFFLGPVTYVDHEGERPVAFTWRLRSPMPEELFEVARSVAAA